MVGPRGSVNDEYEPESYDEQVPDDADGRMRRLPDRWRGVVRDPTAWGRRHWTDLGQLLGFATVAAGLALFLVDESAAFALGGAGAVLAGVSTLLAADLLAAHNQRRAADPHARDPTHEEPRSVVGFVLLALAMVAGGVMALGLAG
jgi:hypothetical protein